MVGFDFNQVGFVPNPNQPISKALSQHKIEPKEKINHHVAHS